MATATKAENTIQTTTVTIASQKNSRYIETSRYGFPGRFYAADPRNLPGALSPEWEESNGRPDGPALRPAERSVYLAGGQFFALTLIPSKVPLLLGYSHQTGEPPWLHSKNPTNRPLHPLSISTSNAAEKSLYAIFLPCCCYQPAIDLTLSTCSQTS
jgi:hypothetical protein